jgi:isoleucyl-tRNA synthetase
MDRWIIAANQHLIKFVRTEMHNYRLYNVVRHMLQFLEQLTNWYVRLNRSRMKGEEGPQEQFTSLNTLFDVLLNTTIMMSCITPFLSEYIYQNLKNGISQGDKNYFADSIHFLQIPQYEDKLLNERIEKMVERMQSAIEIGRKIRDQKNKSIKTPLSKVTIVHSDKQAGEDLITLSSYIKDELNCLEFEVQPNEAEYVVYLSQPEHKEIGSVLKNKYTKDFKEKLNNLGREEILEYLKNGKVNIMGVDIQEGWLQISKKFNEKYSKDEALGVDSSLDMSVMLYMVLDDKLKQKGMAREIVNKVQKLRKASGLNIDDQVEVFYSVPKKDGSVLNQVVAENSENIRSSLRTPFLSSEAHLQSQFVKIAETDYVNPENEADVVHLIICTPNVSFDNAKLQAKYGHLNVDKVNFVNDIKSYVTAFSLDSLRKRVEANGGKLSFKLNDTQVELKVKEDFFFSAFEQVSSK